MILPFSSVREGFIVAWARRHPQLTGSRDSNVSSVGIAVRMGRKWRGSREEELEMKMVEVTLSTLELREHEFSPAQRKSRRRRKQKHPKHRAEGEEREGEGNHSYRQRPKTQSPKMHHSHVDTNAVENQNFLQDFFLT